MIRLVLQWSRRSRRQVFKVAMACSPRARMRACAALTCREPVASAAERHSHGAARSLVTLVGPASERASMMP